MAIVMEQIRHMALTFYVTTVMVVTVWAPVDVKTIHPAMTVVTYLMVITHPVVFLVM
jgi:hypothetical protein